MWFTRSRQPSRSWALHGLSLSFLCSFNIQDFTTAPWLVKTIRYLLLSTIVSLSALACLTGMVVGLGAFEPFFCDFGAVEGEGGVVAGGVVAGGVAGAGCSCWGAGLGCDGGATGLGARYCITAMPTNTSRKASRSF